jgi:hypothetical protein
MNFAGLRKLVEIPSHFMYGTNLSEIDISMLHELTEIDGVFIAHSPTLTNLILPNNSKIAKIGDTFLYGTEAMQSFELSNKTCPVLRSIGDYFMCESRNLYNITISDLPELETIGTSFLARTYDLEKLKIKNLPKLTRIDPHFIHSPVLRIAIMAHLPNISSIGNDVLYGCDALKSIDLNGINTDIVPGLGFLKKRKGNESRLYIIYNPNEHAAFKQSNLYRHIVINYGNDESRVHLVASFKDVPKDS